MGNRNPQSVLKRAREQAMREKREMKKAKKEARALERRSADDSSSPAVDPGGGTDDG